MHEISGLRKICGSSMHHRREWCYSAAMTPRAVKFGRIGGDRCVREDARARLASNDAGSARRRIFHFKCCDRALATTCCVVGNGGMVAGVPSPLFFGKQSEQFRSAARATSIRNRPHSTGPARWEGGGWIPAKRVNAVGATVGHQMLKRNDGDCLAPPPSGFEPTLHSLVALERKSHGRGQVAPL
jgi:hypothetical protein